jgi:hypothetical protein
MLQMWERSLLPHISHAHASAAEKPGQEKNRRKRNEPSAPIPGSAMPNAIQNQVERWEIERDSDDIVQTGVTQTELATARSGSDDPRIADETKIKE